MLLSTLKTVVLFYWAATEVELETVVCEGSPKESAMLRTAATIPTWSFNLFTAEPTPCTRSSNYKLELHIESPTQVACNKIMNQVLDAMGT